MHRSLRLCFVGLLLFTTHAWAQADRAETWEVSAHLTDFSSLSRLGPMGSSIIVDDETGWGFNGAYNFTNRLAVGFDLNYVDPRYLATLVPDGPGLPQTIGANLDVSTIHLKAIVNLIDDDFTPYIEVGAGWTWIDSNIVSGITIPACWWDPWYGNICQSNYETYSDTRTSISTAVGVRWDRDDMVLKASWGIHDVDTNRATKDLELDTIQISWGWKF